MLEFLTWLESSTLGDTLRGLGVWTYGVPNLGHVLGLSVLFGSVLILDLRLLGVWRAMPLGQISRPTVPLAGIGFALAATSGICMLTVNGSEYYGNPFLLFKFTAIAVGLLNALVVASLPGWKAQHERELSSKEQKQLAVTGGISLLCWVTALAAGRMIGYW